MLGNVVRRAIVVVGAFTTLGCYSYASASGAQTAPGTRVAMDLTVRGQADYESKLGAGIERIEGVLEERTPDSAQVKVERTRSRSGGWTYWGGEVVHLPMAALSAFQERKFSTSRTAMAAAGIVAVAAKMVTAGLLGFGGHDRDPNPRPMPPVQPGLRF